MTGNEAREYLESISTTGIVLGMDSMRRLCNRLGNPENKGKVIHIAGTNGKGSTGAIIEQVLIALGYKVGRYTSPAVFDYKEIYRINQKNISEEMFTKVLEKVKGICDGIVADGFLHPTVFEVETAVAFEYFASEECDFTLIEVGMGGREDATNVIEKPVLGVITSISMDHTGFLGDSLAKIAYQKAGIMKRGSSVVKLFQEPEVNEVIEREAIATCGEKNLIWAKASDYEVLSMDIDHTIVNSPYGSLKIAMSGKFQQENMACAMTALKMLEELGYIELQKNMEEVKSSLEKTTWPGRFEVISKKPLYIIDGCHNPDAAKKLQQTIQNVLGGKRIHFVIGVLGDKDYEGIFSKVLPLGESAVCITPPNKRGLAKEELEELAGRYLQDVSSCEQISEAVEAAINKCKEEEDMVLTFGSLSYLGEVKRYVNELCR